MKNETKPSQRNRAFIALVEDDDNIRELLTINLQSIGFKVDSFFSTEQMHRKSENLDYDLIILDIMLPGESGLKFAQNLQKKEQNIPILFISAISQEEKIRQAYLAGAIDYVVKPFEIDQVLLKIQNLLFYFIKRHSAPLPSKICDAHIDWDLMKVTRGNEENILTPKEARVLIYFLENPNQIIERKKLIEIVWGKDVYVTSRNVDNFLVKFRKWFEKDPGNPKIFITYPKKGYAYNTENL
ncbi:MAG: response regulator transcription factor [Spirochaetia bacterium]|nr:response regulator transcription factor [Spirochaetia bacterium]